MQTSRGLVDRMVRAAKLDVRLYEEVEADTSANGQAFLAVLIASMAAGIGAGIASAIEKEGIWFLWGFLLGLGTALIGWVAWSVPAYWLGTTIFKGPETSVTYGELLRTIGFSSAPGVLRILALIPPIAGVVFVVTTLWMMVAMVVAVRQALDYQGTGRAIAVCAIGFPIYAVFLAASLLVLGAWPV